MTENDWTQKISDLLNKELKKYGLYARTLIKIPYSQEILSYDDGWNPNYMETTKFETDLIIYEKDDNKLIPRVIIESKLGSITTHDAITYSTKAKEHKNITPFLRYGIMVGDRKEHPLPGRLFRHGIDFDFMISFKGTEPSKTEKNTLIDLIVKEVSYSKKFQDMLHNNRNKARKRYFVVQKQLITKEID